MNSKAMNIVAKTENGKARILIKGAISGWRDSAEGFTRQVDEIIESGVNDVQLYINSPGGECIEANEIVNVIRRFKGTIAGEGGALVASAAAYIAINCDTFTMPQNGLLMIHKPSGGATGTANDIKAYLKLIETMEATYFENFSKKCKNKEEFKKEWDKGDYWLGASEAKAQGFVDAITDKCRTDKDTEKMITSCGYKGSLALLGYIPENHTTNNQKHSTDMNLTEIAQGLGMSADTSESTFLNAVKGWKKDAERTLTLENELKLIREKEINDLLDKAILEKRITADTKEAWKQTLTEHMDRGKKLLDAISPVTKPTTSTKTKGIGSASGKKLEDLSAKEREELLNSDPQEYERLVSEYETNN